MEPLPLIPRNKITVTREMGCLVREAFQSVFQDETVTWQMSTNLLKSSEQNSDLREIAVQMQAEIIEHARTLDDVEYAEMQVMKSHGYYLCRDQVITSNERAMEMIKLKRHPLYVDLHPNITEKYPLLQSDDLLPPVYECATDFRLDERERVKMKNRLYRSRDSLLDEPSIPAIAPRSCRFDTIIQKKLRKIRTRIRSPIRRVTPVDKRSIIRSEYMKTVLIAQPEELLFHNFEYNKLYKKFLVLKNVSCSTVRYKIEKRSPNSKFIVLYDNDGVERHKIAPGMHVKLTVLFKCDVIEDPEEFLILNVHSGKTVCIKMHAYRDPPLLRVVRTLCLPESGSEPLDMDEEKNSSSLSVSEDKGGYDIYDEQPIGNLRNIKRDDEACVLKKYNGNIGATFECGKCFVSERIILSRKLINDGGDGKFFIMSEIDWCTMNIDDIMDCNMILIPPFAIWPAYFALKSGEYVDIRTYFSPQLYGMQVDKLYMLCDNYAVHPIELIGDGLLFDASFVCIDEGMKKNDYPDYENNDETDYQLNIVVRDSCKTPENHISVENTSGLEIYYRWEKKSAKKFVSNLINSWAHLPVENLCIEPAEGSLNSNSTKLFKVVVQTEDLEACEYCAILRLFIEDIPLAAIPKDCDLMISECYTKRRNCPITVDVLLAEIEVRVQCIPEKEFPPRFDILEDTESEKSSNGWSLDETGKRDAITTHDHYSPLSSMPAIQTLQGPSICGINGVKFHEDYENTKNSENPRNATLVVIENSEVDTSAPAIPRLDFHYQKSNTAILIPGRPLYIGIKQVYTLRLQNMICKHVSYAWGHPIEKKECRMLEVHFNPDKGSISPMSTALIEVVCLPVDTGKLDNFFIPCFIGGQEDPIMLGIECSIEGFYVTFIFLPMSSETSSPCVDSVRVEWHMSGHKSALNLNNLQMNRRSKIETEQELKNIDLDAGQVVATAAVGPTPLDIENPSSVSFTELPPLTQRELDDKNERNSGRTQKKIVEKTKVKISDRAESESEKVKPSILRSWESLLKGIVWTVDKPDEFIALSKPQPVIPFYRTIVPPVMQNLAIEFIDLPLRTVNKRTFVIRNETPANSSYSITLKHFGPVKRAKKLKPKDIINITYAAAMGHKKDDYWEEIKPQGQGVVLVIEPVNGNLTPYESVAIDIYVYADTWGVYVDEITVAITGLPDYIFGVCIEVVGSPIAYPICVTGINKTPVLRFGTADPDTEKVTRKILIENTSSIPIFVNWFSYLIDPQYVENSIPFDISLLMYSPITNEISGGMCTDLKIDHAFEKITISDSSTEEISSKFESLEGFSLSNCCRSYTAQTQFTETLTSTSTTARYCSGNVTSDDENSSQNGESKIKKIRTDRNNLDDESVEYNSENEIGTATCSEQITDKETDLELAVTPYYGKPDYSIFAISPKEIIIPAKEKRWLEVDLNTTECCIKSGDTEIRGHLMGFIRVAPVHRYKADCYSRVDGTMLTPTEIQLEARIPQRKLSQEIIDSDRTFKSFEN